MKFRLQENPKKENTKWERYSDGEFDCFRNQKYEFWLGLKKNGRPKAGRKAKWGDNAIKFKSTYDIYFPDWEEFPM